MFWTRLFCLAGLLVFSSARARAYSLQELLENRLDPGPRYLTIATAHFQVHYPAHLSEVAAHVAATAERIHPKVSQALRWKDEGITHIVVGHHSDQTGIFTSVYPHRQIFFDIALPHQGVGLNDYADWHEWLLTHEFSHIAHLETLRGAYKGLAPVLGSWVRPNLATPAWLKEGLATYLESTLTARGRGESAGYRMMARMAVADGILDDPDFAAPDTISTFDKKSWPWTVRPYLLGYYLIRRLERGQEGALASLARATAGAFPYRLAPALRAAGAESFDRLWKDTLDEIRRESSAQLERIKQAPLTVVEHLTETGFFYFGPEVSPNGKWLIATRENPEEENAVMRFDLEGDRVGAPKRLFYRSTGYQSGFSKSSRFLVFDQTARARRYYLTSDIHIFDLKTEKIMSVSPYFRARDPDIHPDGKHVVFVANEGGKNRLYRTDTSWSNPEDLLGDVGYRRLSSPRFSPDGSRIVLGVHNDETGGEDLWLIGPQGTQVLASDGFSNRSPRWAPDGKRILFSSDRTGVFNIHSVEPDTGKRHRLTNVMGGLFFPAVDPDLRWVYAVSYRGKGYDLARFRFEPANWIEEESLSKSSAPVARSPLPEEVRLAGTAVPYKGRAHLRAQYLIPSLVWRPDSIQSGARLGAVDPLFFQNYELDLRYDSATKVPVGSFFYYNGALPWAVDLKVDRDVVPLSGGSDLKSLSGNLAVNVPLSDVGAHFYLRPGLTAQSIKFRGSSDYSGASLSLRYDTQFTQIGHTFPEMGTLADIGVNQYVKSSIGDLTATSVSGSLRRHFALGPRRQSLHASIDGAGYVAGQSDLNTFFFAGGARSFPLDLESPLLIYGYKPNSLAGTGLAVGSLHYTAALKDIQRGLGRLPVILGRLSGGLRVQAAALSPQRRRGLPLSFGAELFQDLNFGYIFDLTASLGAYRGDPAYGGRTQFVFSLTGRGL